MLAFLDCTRWKARKKMKECCMIVSSPNVGVCSMFNAFHFSFDFTMFNLKNLSNENLVFLQKNGKKIKKTGS